MKKLKNTINGVSKMKITDKINSFWLIMILVGGIAVVSVACGPKAGGKGITTAGEEELSLKFLPLQRIFLQKL